MSKKQDYVQTTLDSFDLLNGRRSPGDKNVFLQNKFEINKQQEELKENFRTPNKNQQDGEGENGGNYDYDAQEENEGGKLFDRKEVNRLKTIQRDVRRPNEQDDDLTKYFLRHWSDFFNQASPQVFDYDNDKKCETIATIYSAMNLDLFIDCIVWGSQQILNYMDVYVDFSQMMEIIRINSDQSSEHRELMKSFELEMNSLVLNSSLIVPSMSLGLSRIRLNKNYENQNQKASQIGQHQPYSQQQMHYQKTLCRIYNFTSLTALTDIKANLNNAFVQIKGIVLKTCPIRLLVVETRFKCGECNIYITKKFSNGMFSPPIKCERPNCKGRYFIPDKTQSNTVMYQRIQIQELQDGQSTIGRVPRTQDCELKDSLVGRVISGDTLLLTGTLKTESSEAGKKGLGLFNSYLDVNSIMNLQSENQSLIMDDDEVTEGDVRWIQKLGQDPNIFNILVKSLCPTIYGQELIKAGLILSILGGSDINELMQENKHKNSQNPFSEESGKTQFRSDCHVLLIGDPGLGKSQLLKFVASVTPRSVYVCGSATTNAGLTVAVQRDPVTGEGTLQAGALILSDQGVCCIDEFDKMLGDHQALLESMEQQTVSLAKSGVMCSLQSRASVIASANPVGGHYNKAKNIKDNIKISNAILSRFDLIFLLLDNPDPNRDKKLSQHIMKIHNLKKRSQEDLEQRRTRPNPMKYSQFNMRLNDQSMDLQDQEFRSFNERLQRGCEKIQNAKILEPSHIRKYIAYAKKNCHPILSREAGDIIKKFFLNLRQHSFDASSIPITNRQLESLIRLAQARAQLELRNEVTVDDARDVVELMQESLFDALEDISSANTNTSFRSDKMGGKNINPNNVASLSNAKQTKIFIQKLQQEARLQDSYLFEYSELTKIAQEISMNVGEFSNYIDKLNVENVIILKISNPKTYELLHRGF